MRLDDRFDDLVASLGGFYRTWHVFAGLELGLFAALRAAGDAGLTAGELAERTGVEPALAARWTWGADAHALVEIADGRIRVPADVASILLDADRREYLGGQFQFAAVGSLDFDRLADVFRTGRPILSRPDRYRVAIERLTAPGRGGVLRGGPGRVPAARSGAGAGQPDRRRPLRRRPVADRHGQAVRAARRSPASSTSRTPSSGRAPTLRLPTSRIASPSSRAR